MDINIYKQIQKEIKFYLLSDNNCDKISVMSPQVISLCVQLLQKYLE